MLDYAYSIRQTVTTSELVPTNMLNIGTAPDFEGPVQFLITEFDDLLCAGECKGTYDTAFVGGLFPKARDVKFYVQEGTCHGLTMHRKANLGFKATLDWLDRNGLSG
jgi:hypothetical protein